MIPDTNGRAPMALMADGFLDPGYAGDPVAELQDAIIALEAVGRRLDLDAATRTAVRVRLMRLVDRLEIEQGKQRLVEGNFAAARYHFSTPRHQSLKLRLARASIRVAPRLVRMTWLRIHQLTTGRLLSDHHPR